MWFLLSFLVIIAILYYKRLKICYKLRNVPCSFAWPIIGHCLDFPKPEDSCEYLSNLHDTIAKTFKLYIGPEILTCTSDANLAEKILTSQALTMKSKEYFFMKDWWGDGLLTSAGAKWRSRRKLLTPAFHYTILEDFIDIFDKHGKYLIENFESHISSETVDIHKIYALYTLDVICESSMGTTILAQKNPQHEFLQAIHHVCLLAYKRTIHPLFRYDPLYMIFGSYNEDQKQFKILNDLASTIIKERRKVISQSNFFENKLNKKNSFLDILLTSFDEDGNPLSDLDIQEEVNTFLFEGLDTTAAALSYLTYMLSIHPTIQAKCYEEIKGILGNDQPRKFTLDELKEMKYTEMVIKETLRLYPSVPLLGRKFLEDYEYDGFVLPENTIIAINVWKINRNPKIFENPDKFIPERFIPENRNKYGPFDYIPFSAGQRNCIGQKFAMLEMKTAISKILLNFELKKPIPNFQPQFAFAATMQPLNGVHVKLERRKL